jgi:hypothetical protein
MEIQITKKEKKNISKGNLMTLKVVKVGLCVTITTTATTTTTSTTTIITIGQW